MQVGSAPYATCNHLFLRYCVLKSQSIFSTGQFFYLQAHSVMDFTLPLVLLPGVIPFRIWEGRNSVLFCSSKTVLISNCAGALWPDLFLQPVWEKEEKTRKESAKHIQRAWKTVQKMLRVNTVFKSKFYTCSTTQPMPASDCEGLWVRCPRVTLPASHQP